MSTAFRSPDLTSPRFKTKFLNTLNKSFITRFKKKYPQYAHYSSQVLINALKAHNVNIWNEVINTRDGIELQGGMGCLYMGMSPLKKRKSIAYKESAALGMKVYHKNWETDNMVAKIIYTNYGVRTKFENRQLWYFVAVREFKRAVSATCAKKWRQYILLENVKHIYEVLDKRVYKDRARKRQDKDLVTYNEFDLE